MKLGEVYDKVGKDKLREALECDDSEALQKLLEAHASGSGSRSRAACRHVRRTTAGLASSERRRTSASRPRMASTSPQMAALSASSSRVPSVRILMSSEMQVGMPC